MPVPTSGIWILDSKLSTGPQKCRANLYSGKSSKSIEVEIELSPAGLVIYEPGRTQQLQYDQIQINSRLGNTPRWITLPEGAKLEVFNNDYVDLRIANHPQFSRPNLIHRMESSLKFAAAMLAVVAAVGYISFFHLLPAFSEKVAYWIPRSFSEKITEKAIESLVDAKYFEESKLLERDREQMLKDFSPYLKSFEHLNLNIHFYYTPKIGANALAFPDGTIVITDQLITMAENNTQVLAVLFHEIGHVEYRHSLDMLVKSSAIGIFVSLAFGDISFSALPLAILNNTYSQEAELEADAFSVAHLQKHEIPMENLSRILELLHKQIPLEGVPSFLLSHPHLEDRLKQIPKR